MGVAIVGAQTAAWLMLRQGPVLVAYCDLSYLVLLVLACGVAIRNAVRSRRATRLIWSFLAAAFGVWALVPVGWLNRVVLHGRISSSVFINPPLFLHIVLLIAAAVSRPHVKLPNHRPYRATVNFLVLLFVWVFAYAFYLFPYQYGDKSAVMMLRFEAIYFVENGVLLAILGRLVVRSELPWKRIYLHMLGASTLYTGASLITNVFWALKDPSGDLPGTKYPDFSGAVGVAFTAAIFWFLWIALEGGRLGIRTETGACSWIPRIPTHSAVLGNARGTVCSDSWHMGTVPNGRTAENP